MKLLLAGSALALLPFMTSAPALAQDETEKPATAGNIQTDVIVVTAARSGTIATDMLDTPEQAALPADTAAIAARTPGGALVGNGGLSGQLAYRGLFGERVTGKVNGQRFATGGPNAMDPPLHYAPSILLERIEIARGVAPVSSGPGLAGAVNAVLLQQPFAQASGTDASARFMAQYRSVDDSYAVGGLAGIASEHWRLGVIGSREQGEDYRFPGGTATGTSFERNLYGVRAGYRAAGGEFFLEYRRSETDPSGNPPFALDIVYFDTDFLQGGFKGELAKDLTLDVRLGHVAVRHLMDNQTLRQPAAPAASARATFADADSFTGEASLRFGSARRHVRVGGDFELADKFVRITNPFNAEFFLDAQSNLGAERYGAFAELRSAMGAVEFELGGRIDRTSQDSGVPRLGSAVPMGPRMLANAFAASAREASDTSFDLVLRGWMPGEAITPRVTLARKVRVPSTLERFAWLPTEASYGLADGNIYVGNAALKPEVAYIAEAGFDLSAGALTFRPTLFYRRVDEYIQGTPFDATPGVVDSTVEMVSAMNGDPTPLMFRNVDAELFGIDLDFRAELGADLAIDGTASWVRGKRRDVNDNLYRVALPNLRLAAIWSPGRWSLGAELQAAGDQAKVSATNGESPSDGYVVLGLSGSFELSERISLSAGVENLFDEYYQPHLSGLNRVADSDVALGERLPGAGRGVWARITAGF